MKTFTLIAALLFAPAVYAKGTGTPTTTTTTKTADTAAKPAKPAKLSKDDLQVLAHYHALNLREIDMGKAAVKISKTDGVKEYGKMLITDHGDSDKKLMAFAKARGQVIPAEKLATPEDKKAMADAKAAGAKIKKLKGAEFDSQFLAAMVEGHEKELAMVDAKAAAVTDTELADVVKAKKDTLKMHADHARELQSPATH